MWFTSDTHFCHTNIIKYCNRPFKDINEMNDMLIKNWNSLVQKDDIIYHLGDFIYRCKNKKRIKEILYSLNGKIILIKGSHDKQTLLFPERFSSVYDNILIRINDNYIFMSHYLHKIWPRSHYGSWHLFGHCHGGMNKYAEQEGKLLDVSTDCHNFKPVSFDMIRAIMNTRPINFNDIRKRNKKSETERY